MTEPTTIEHGVQRSGRHGHGWEDARAVLESAELSWIATVHPDRRPHLTPLVAVWLDDALHFCTGETEQKAAKLRGNQNVLLLMGCNQWDGGMDVVLKAGQSELQITALYVGSQRPGSTKGWPLELLARAGRFRGRRE